jgi:hypothetical protein
MAQRKPRRPSQCQTLPCRRRATALVVWCSGHVTHQCQRHVVAMTRAAVRAGLPLRVMELPKTP